MTKAQKPSKRSMMSGVPKLPNRKWVRFILWARRLKLAGRIELVLAILAVVSAIATYIAMSQKSAPFDVTSGRTMRAFLGINLALLLALGVAIGRWFVRIWLSRKGMAAGSRLHTKVTGFFIAIAIVPPIIMTVFSALFLEFGIQSWFSEKIRFTLNNSLEVAETYMLEHRANIEKDMLAIAQAYSRLNSFQQRDQLALQRVADTALTTRLLNEIMVIEDKDGAGEVLARASDRLELRTPQLDNAIIDRVRSGQSVVMSDAQNNSVIGIIRLSAYFQPTYLYISRDLSPNVLGYLSATQSAVADYENLEGQRSDIQLQFNVVFIIIALLILLAAIWLGLWFSSRLVTPLSNLVDAAERVGQGDLDVRVPSVPTSDEVGTLSRAFNRMTDQLARHQRDLIAANAELDQRRRFLEEVLEGVSAGVIGLQQDGTIFLPNRSAINLLGIEYDDLVTNRLEEVVPAFSEILRQSEESGIGEAKGQIQLEVKGEIRILMVRAFVEREDDNAIKGYVVTFDDLTEQLADQRTAAWADVARRIAHEIKNPLTPIQLSAERLKRKYLKQIESDSGIFSQCTDTIIRQVGDLRRMVDEFSSFARMPAPLFKDTDIKDVIKQSVFLQDVATPKVQFTATFETSVGTILCDGRLVGQALTNILKNAVESVTARIERDEQSGADTIEPGFVRLTAKQDADRTVINVEDNGLGLPQDQKDRLMEPYVTTRSKGTGLGLAIVRRIMEEHGGTVRIVDRSPIGARAVLMFSHSALQKRAIRATTKNADEAATAVQ
ncbi:sensor histidine kinase NtrY-like [Kordiimonas pumila]|uniref:histidine kinase n=1 Tax=Kordiimonas pumila TaxID=2161677 RepID=A0ABV7D1M7_9PROT|nr:PAS domain-containing sensor histidine kinase [Kordiimonas pumila]